MDPIWYLVPGGLAAWWAGHVIWPYKRCPSCRGRARHDSPTAVAWRVCRRCDGTGTVIRVGRLVFELLRGKGDR